MTMEFPSREHRVIFPATQIYLRLKKPGHSEKEALQSLVERKCESLFRDYRAPWWLFNGHARTLYGFRMFSDMDQMWYERKILRVSDGGTLGLDFAPIDTSHLEDDSPVVVVIPGLTGGSHEAYIRAILAPASTAVTKGGLGYRVVVVNLRGCAGVPITSPRLYTPGHTDDFRLALVYISQLYPQAPLLGVGFSLGAGILIRYLAEEGTASWLVSGCALGCPWDNVLNCRILHSTFFQRNFWARILGTALRQLLVENAAALRSFPDHPLALALPEALALRYPTLLAFDTIFSSRVGGPEPIFPFPDLDTYYDWAASHIVLKDVTVPLLAIDATDDPLVRAVPVDSNGNPSVVLARTRIGGHLGWFKAGGGRWITRPVLEWLQLTAEDLAHNFNNRLPVHVDGAGFFRETGRDGMGCKHIGDGGMINGNRGPKGLFHEL
ncbi:AB-hydrolase YheT [Mycena albidolilacea]|uniref:AB-hydrolase YheT n=1 Tax=Mycena albidolilacea TaxID=1033008 RepID=A0AAD6Z6S0_9AGAR|nr:AB-hydrolase YheT [Mycena albidolilacea]